MKLLKNFIFFKDIFKYNKFKTVFKSLKLPKLRKNDYNYYQKITSLVLIFFILFNLGFRVPFSQFFNLKTHADNKDFFNLVWVVVDNDLYDSVDWVLKRYAKDIESVLSETKVVLIPTPKDASAFQIASLIESLYYEWYKSVNAKADFESKLVWTLLVWDIPLPVVKDWANFSKTILPYTDFDNKTYVYDHKEEIYVKSENLNEKIEPEIWHWVVSPNTWDEDEDIQSIKDYFDKNHDFYIWKWLFDREKWVINWNPEDKIPWELSATWTKIDEDLDEYKPYIFYFDQFREKEAINTINYKWYVSAQKNKEDLAYDRLTKENAEKIKEEVLWEEEEELSSLIVESFSWTELPDGSKIAPPEEVTPEEAAEDRYHCRFPNVGAFYWKDITVTFNWWCKHSFTVEDWSVRKELPDWRLWKPIATEAPHALAISWPHWWFKVKTCTVTRKWWTETQNAMPKPGEAKEYQWNDIFDKAPDILTRYSIAANIKTFAEIFNFSALSELRKNIYNAWRWSKNKDKVEADFIPEIISTIDLISDEIIKNSNDTLETAIDNVVKEGWSSNLVLFESVHMWDFCSYRDFVNYYYGKPGASITKAEDCSIFRWSTDSWSKESTGKLVEANRWYNVKNMKPDYDTIWKACVKKCKSDTECMSRWYWWWNSPINLNKDLTNSAWVTNKTIVSEGWWFMDPSEKNNGFFNLKKHNLGASITPLLDLVGAVEVCLSTVNVVGRMNKNDWAEDESTTMMEVYSPLNCYKWVWILVEQSTDEVAEWDASCEVTYSIEDKIEWRCGTNNLEKWTVDFNDVHTLVAWFEELSTKTYWCDETPPSYGWCNTASIYIDWELFWSYAASWATNCGDGQDGNDDGGWWPDLIPCVFNYKTIPWYIMHESPTSSELATQVDWIAASALPVDKDKYVDFLWADLSYKKINYPYLFRQELDEDVENTIENEDIKLKEYLGWVTEEVNKVIMEQIPPEGNDIYDAFQKTWELTESDLYKHLEDLPIKTYSLNWEEKEISYKDTLAFALYWKNIDNISEKYAFVLENYLSDQFNKDISYWIPKNKKLYELSYMWAPWNASSMYVKMDPEAKIAGNPYEEEVSKNASLDNMLTGLNLWSWDDNSSDDTDNSNDGEDFECWSPDGVPIMRWFPAILCWLKTMLPPTVKISTQTCWLEDLDNDSDEVDLSTEWWSWDSWAWSSSDWWDELDSEETKSCNLDWDKNWINDCIEKWLTDWSIDLKTDSLKYNYNSNGTIKIGLLNSDWKLLSYDNSTMVKLELSKLELVDSEGGKEVVYNWSWSTLEEKKDVWKYFNFSDTTIKVSEWKADYAFSTLTQDVDAYIKASLEISNYKKTSKIYLEKTIKVEVRWNNLVATTFKIERDDDATLNVLSWIDMVLAAGSTNIYLVDWMNSNVEDKQKTIDNSSTSKEKLIFSIENYTESGSKIEVKYPLRVNLYNQSEKIIDDKLINLTDTIDYFELTALKKSGEYVLQIEDAEWFKINKTFQIKADKAYRGEVVLWSNMLEVWGIVTTNYLIAYDKYWNAVAGELYNVEWEIKWDWIEFVDNGEYNDEISFQMLEWFKVFRTRTTDDRDDNTITFKVKDVSWEELFEAENTLETIEDVYLFLQPLQREIKVWSWKMSSWAILSGTLLKSKLFTWSQFTGSLSTDDLFTGSKFTWSFASWSEFIWSLSNWDSFVWKILTWTLFTWTLSTLSLFEWFFSEKISFIWETSTWASFTGVINSWSTLSWTIQADWKIIIGSSFSWTASIPYDVNQITTWSDTGLYGYKFSVRDKDWEIIDNFNSRLYLSLNSIFWESTDSYVQVESWTWEVYFTTKQTAWQNVKLSFQVEWLKNVYTKYIDILPEKPIKMDLILSKDKIEATKTDYANLKVELKDRYGNLVYNDNSTDIEIELKEEYEVFVKPEKLSSKVTAWVATIKINATNIPWIAYLKVKADPWFTSSFKIEWQAPIAKTALTIEWFTSGSGLTDLWRKFFEESDSENYSFKYYKVEDLENSEDFKDLSADTQNILKTLWEGNNSINIAAQDVNIIEIETFYFWNKDKIKWNSYNSLYTVLLWAEYWDISQKDYLAWWILFDKENRWLTVTSLLNNPYNYSDIVSINSLWKIKTLENSQDLTQDIRYIANIDKDKKLYFDIYNYAMSEYLGKIYYNLDEDNDLKLCEWDSDMNFTECAKDLDKTTILLKNLKEWYTWSIDDGSLIIKDTFWSLTFQVTKDGEISHSAYVSLENYVSDDLDEWKEAVFSIKEWDEVIWIFSYKLVDSVLNVTRNQNLFIQKLESLKNSVIVYMSSNKYWDRFVQTKEKDTMMIYYNDPFSDESELNNFSSAEGFTYESFKQNLKAWWSETNKALLLYASWESVWESTKKYASFSLINLWDPVVKLKNVKKKFEEDEDDKPECSEIEWKDWDICDRTVKSWLKVSIDSISVNLDQKITDILANDSIEVEVPVVGNPWVIYKDWDKRKAQTWERMWPNQKSKFRYALEESWVILKNWAEIWFVVSWLVRMWTSNQKIKSATTWVTREWEDIWEWEEEEETWTWELIYRSFNSTNWLQITKDEKNVAYKVFDYNNDKLQDLLVVKNDSYAEIIENRGNFNFNHKWNIVYIPEMWTNWMMEAWDYTWDWYWDIFYVTKGKPYLLNNVEKDFSKISLEEQFSLSWTIIKISSFDMDNDKIKDIVTMDSLWKIYVFYWWGTSNNPLFSKLEVWDWFTISLNEDKKDWNWAIYYDWLANIDNQTALDDIKEENEELIEDFNIVEWKQSINTQQIDWIIFDKVSYNVNDENTEEVFDDSMMNDENFGDVYSDTIEWMGGVEEYSWDNLNESSNNTKQVSFIRNEYAKSFWIEIEKKYEDIDKGTLEPLDKVKITVDITNNSWKAMKKVAYAEKIQEIFSFSDDDWVVKTSKEAKIKFNVWNYDFLIDGFTLASWEKITLEYEVALIPVSYWEIETGYFEKWEAWDDEYWDILLKVDKKSCDTKPDIFRSVPWWFSVNWSLVHTWSIKNTNNFSWAYDLVVDWNYAYMTSMLWDRLNILDIKDPTKPILTWSLINNGWTIRLDWAASIVKSGNYLYVASNESDAIQVIDVSDPTMPTETGQLVNTTTLDWVRGITKSGSYLYVTVENYDALQIIDIEDPVKPEIVWTIVDNKKLDWAREIKIVWNYAYVTSYDWDWLTIVDISNPKSPKVVSNITDSINLKWAWWIEIDWNYAYVGASLNDSINIIDISNPKSPKAVTDIFWWGFSLITPIDLLVEDDKLYISSYWLDAINVADVTDPKNPKFLSKVLHNSSNPLLDWVHGLFKVWDMVYASVYDWSALEILTLTKEKTYTWRAYEKWKIESICDEESLELPEEFQKNSLDEDDNGVPDYLDELTINAWAEDKAEIIEYSEGALSTVNEDSDWDWVPDSEDTTPTYDGEDEDTTSFLDSVNEWADNVSDWIDELSSGLCNWFWWWACISSPVNRAPLAPWNDPVVLWYPVWDWQKVWEWIPVFAVPTNWTPPVWPPMPSWAWWRLDWNPEWIGRSVIRIFVTPTITWAIWLAICFWKNTISKTESPPSLFPIIWTYWKCIIVAKPFLWCSWDWSDWDVVEKNYPINFGWSWGPNWTEKEEWDFAVTNWSCVDTKELWESKTFSFDETFVKNYIEYKETKSDETLSTLVDTFKDIGKWSNKTLTTEPLIELWGSENKDETVDISFVADIDVNALANGEFKDVIKLKNNLIKSFPAFLMDWVNRQVEEIVTKLTTFPSIIVILPEFSGIADSSWWNFFDWIKDSFKKWQKEWEWTENELGQEINDLEGDKKAQDCENITSEDEGYFACMLLDLQIKKSVLEKDYNPSQVTSWIKAVYDFIGSLPMVALKSQIVNVNIPWITNSSLFKAKINFELTKKQRQIEIERATEDRSSLTSLEKAAGDKIIVDARALIKSLDKNIAVLEEYKRFPHDLVKILNKKEDRLEQILCSVDTIYTLFWWRLWDNWKRFKKWVELYILIKAIMKSWQIILDLFDEYDKSCKECKNERYDLRTFIWRLVSIIIPKIPVIQFPKWPNIVIDLHNIKVWLNITLPEFNFNTRPIVIPSLPKLYLPDIPSVKVKLPTLPILPSIELPELPDLPTLPTVELPNLPPPPKLPKIFSAIEAVLKILKIVTKIMCLIQHTPFAPERTAWIKIAYLTDRQGFNPLDYIDLSLPQYSYSFVDSINITTYVNFEVDAEFLLEFAKQWVKPLNNFTNDVVNLFNNKLPDLDFSNVQPDDVKIDLWEKSWMSETTNKETSFNDSELSGLTKFIVYGFYNLYWYVKINKDETVSNEEFVYLVNKGLSSKSIVWDESTKELRQLWKDVANMTYSKEDKFINDLKERNKAKFDTLKGIINTEKQITKDQINSIKNFENKSNIKFISDIKKSNVDWYNELMRKHNLETVKATINLISDDNKEQKDLQKDWNKIINRLNTWLNNYSEKLLAANTWETPSSWWWSSCETGTGTWDQAKYKYNYKWIYIIEEWKNYRLFDYIEELSWKETLGHFDIDNDTDEDLIYMVKNELYIKENTRIEVEKEKNTIHEPLELAIEDNKFYNGEIFYESLNNIKESVSFDSYINFSFDAPSNDDVNNFRLEFYTLIDKYLNEDYDNYTPKWVMKHIIDSFSDINSITKIEEKSKTGYTISSNLAYIDWVWNNVNENIVLTTKELIPIKDDLEENELVSLSYDTYLYAKDNSFTIKYYKEDPEQVEEITVWAYENIKFEEWIKIFSLSWDAYIEGKENLTLSWQTIKDHLYLPLFSWTKIYLENEDNPLFNESSHIDIKYYDNTENNIDLRTVKQYELFDLWTKKSTYQVYTKEENDFYYSRGFAFKDWILWTKSNQAMLSPQISSDTSKSEINLDEPIKIPVYQKQTYNFTPYLYDTTWYSDFYIDFDLNKDSDSDWDATNDRDTKEENVQVTTKTVKVDFGPYDEVFTKDIGITLKDLAWNITYQAAKLEVYAPNIEVNSQTWDIVTWKLDEELEEEPINLYRYRWWVISKLLNEDWQQKIYTNSTWAYTFDVKTVNDKWLSITKDSIEIAKINENTWKISIKNLVWANIKVLSSNNELNDKSYVKIILEDNSWEIYYEYFDFNKVWDLFVLDNFKDADNNWIYLKLNDLNNYSYYKIPVWAPYNPGAISIYSISDKDKTPLFSIYPNWEINTYWDNYELVYSEYWDNVVLKLYDKRTDKYIGEVLMKVADWNYIVK